MPPVTQEEINTTGMSTADLSQRLAPTRETPLPSGVTETPQQTLQRARSMTVEPTVTAERAVNPVTAPQVPQPQVGQIPSRVASTAQAVANESEQNFIAPQTEEARRLRELRGEQASLAGVGSLSDLFTEQQEAFGLPESVRELKDINLQLADMQTASDLTKTRIGAGNSIAQGNREITQEDREAAVRQAGLAARAAVLQGNIETARQSALDAVNIEYQDRQLERQNLIDQINAIQPVVDEQTSQLLEQEKRQYEAELAATEELKDTIANAMVSGASQQEIAQLTSDRVDDQTKLQLARTITARGATEMRDLEIERAETDIAAKNASIAQGWARVDLAERKFNYEQQQNALNQELKALKEAGEIDEQQEEQQQKVERALRLRDLTKQIRGHAGFNLSVGSVGSRVFNPLEGGLAGQVYNYLSGQGEGFDALYDQLTESLTLDNLDKMSGVLTDRDIQVLRSAATRLRKTTTEEEFLDTLDEMDSIFQRTITENGVTPQQARFYYDVDENTLNEVDQIWGDPVDRAQTTASTINTNTDF